MTLQIGEVLKDRYRILQILASGGMGIVYRAKDESLGVEVAIKEAIPGRLTSEQMQKNAAILAGLHHPSIPRITDTFKLAGDSQILVMDFVPGEDLKKRVETNGPLKIGEAVEIITAIGSALQYMHRQVPPIIHLDVKPGNIRIKPDGKAMLVDFDLATTVQENQNRPTTHEQGLTPGFAAPEQYNRMADTSSDQYGLAATLFYMLTGSVLPDGLSRASGNSQLPRKALARIPLDILTCLEKALQVNPNDRYLDIQAFLDALASVIRTQPELSSTTTKKQKYSRPQIGVKAILTIAGISLGVMAVLVTGIVLLTSLPGKAPAPSSISTGTPLLAVIASTAPVKSTQPLSTSTVSIRNTPTLEIRGAAKPTPLGGGTGVFAFVSERNGIPQLFLGSTSSAQIEQLTEIPEGACQPDWSPDGKRLVFISPCIAKAQTAGKTEPYGGAGLFFLSIENKQIIPIPSQPGGDYDPAWSPDGQAIVFTSLRSQVPQVFTYEVNSDKTSQLTSTTTGNRQPAWSPDGKKIAFCSKRTGTWQIWEMDGDGQNQKVVSNQESGAAFNPDWSADGQTIVFSQTNSLLLSMKKVGIASAGDRILNSRLTFASNPDISPDGFWILLDSNLGGTNQVYRISSTGSGAEPLTPLEEKSYQPVWKPAPSN